MRRWVGRRYILLSLLCWQWRVQANLCYGWLQLNLYNIACLPFRYHFFLLPHILQQVNHDICSDPCLLSWLQVEYYLDLMSYHSWFSLWPLLPLPWWLAKINVQVISLLTDNWYPVEQAAEVILLFIRLVWGLGAIAFVHWFVGIYSPMYLTALSDVVEGFYVVLLGCGLFLFSKSIHQFSLVSPIALFLIWTFFWLYFHRVCTLCLPLG